MGDLRQTPLFLGIWGARRISALNTSGRACGEPLHRTRPFCSEPKSDTRHAQVLNVDRPCCGWIADRYGVNWQIVPKIMPDLLTAPDREGANRAFQAMMGMRRIDIAAMERAFAGAAV